MPMNPKQFQAYLAKLRREREADEKAKAKGAAQLEDAQVFAGVGLGDPLAQRRGAVVELGDDDWLHDQRKKES